MYLCRTDRMFHRIALIADVVPPFGQLIAGFAAKMFRYYRIMFTVLDPDGYRLVRRTELNDVICGKVG